MILIDEGYINVCSSKVLLDYLRQGLDEYNRRVARYLNIPVSGTPPFKEDHKLEFQKTTIKRWNFSRKHQTRELQRFFEKRMMLDAIQINKLYH